MRSYEVREGYAAYQCGLSIHDNPYPEEWAEYEEWQEGYWQAMEDD